MVATARNVWTVGVSALAPGLTLRDGCRPLWTWHVALVDRLGRSTTIEHINGTSADGNIPEQAITAYNQTHPDHPY